MYYHFIALGILALFIAIGFLYQISTILFFLGFSFIFLLDKSNYLNHFYLIVLLSFIMIFMPANRALSVDAKIFPHLKSNYIPSWTFWWIKIQIGIAYFYGGIAKINSDWLQGEPMRMWLKGKTDFPVIGQWFTEEWMVYFFSYSGLILDLIIFPMLIFKKTRLLGALVITLFHLINHEMFYIGIFPWFMMFATAIYFPPEKLRFWKKYDEQKPQTFDISKLALWGVGIYLFIQLSVPFRHYLFDGNVNWTEEGHRFAWHMKLRGKSGNGNFVIVYPKTKEIKVVDLEEHLTTRQQRKMKSRPDMILQFVRYLKKEYDKNGENNIEIYANVLCSLNGRPEADLIDSSIDLTKVEYPFYKKAEWILPLKLPLK